MVAHGRIWPHMVAHGRIQRQRWKVSATTVPAVGLTFRPYITAYGRTWPHMAAYGRTWPHSAAEVESQCHHCVRSGADISDTHSRIWVHVAACGCTWPRLATYGCHMGAHGHIWLNLSTYLYGCMWQRVCVNIWQHMVAHDRLCCIWLHMAAHGRVWSHLVASDPILLQYGRT